LPGSRSNQADVARKVIRTTDGGYLLVGDADPYGPESMDFFVVRTDSFGSMEWNKTYGGTNDERADSVVQSSDEGYVIAGRTRSFGAGGFDFWLVKINTTGEEVWSKTYGGSSDDYAASVVRVNDEGYVIAGTTYSFGAGSFDVWLIRTDVELGLFWADSTADTIIIYRGATDPYWNYVRVRIWKVKANP